MGGGDSGVSASAEQYILSKGQKRRSVSGAVRIPAKVAGEGSDMKRQRFMPMMGVGAGGVIGAGGGRGGDVSGHLRMGQQPSPQPDENCGRGLISVTGSSSSASNLVRFDGLIMGGGSESPVGIHPNSLLGATNEISEYLIRGPFLSSEQVQKLTMEHNRMVGRSGRGGSDSEGRDGGRSLTGSIRGEGSVASFQGTRGSGLVDDENSRGSSSGGGDGGRKRGPSGSSGRNFERKQRTSAVVDQTARGKATGKESWTLSDINEQLEMEKRKMLKVTGGRKGP